MNDLLPRSLTTLYQSTSSVDLWLYLETAVINCSTSLSDHDDVDDEDDEDDDDDDDDDEDDGTPKHWYVRVVENAEGSRNTVSLVGLQAGETEYVVGDKAKNLIGSNFWASHRLLGLKHADELTNR